MVNYYRGIKYSRDTLAIKFHIKVPTKIIWGEGDTALLVDNLIGAEKYIDDLTVVKFPGHGHFIQIEAPNEVNEEMNIFI